MTVQNYNYLPDEVLVIIFRELRKSDLPQCQIVCRSWHMAATRLFMESISLMCNTQVKTFLRYIDDHPSYAEFVQRFHIDSDWSYQTLTANIDTEHLKELFSRQFPNVRELKWKGFRAVEDSGIYEKIIKACPNVENVDSDEDINGNELIKHLIFGYRQSLTHLNTYLWDMSPSYPYSQAFPLLQHLVDYRNIISSWEKCLSLFHKEFTLKSLEFRKGTEVKEGFMERYLEKLTREEQSNIIDKLSKLKVLKLRDITLCRYSIQFISRYMTGLQDFTCKVSVNDTANVDVQRGLVELQGLICRLPDLQLDFESKQKFLLDNGVASLCEKHYNQIPANRQCPERILHVKTQEYIEYDDRISFTLESKSLDSYRLKRQITIAIEEVSPRLLRFLQECVSKCNVNTLALPFESRKRYFDESISIFQKALSSIPSVKKVLLTVPHKKADYGVIFHTKQPIFPQVTHLELDPIKQIRLQFIWDTCLDMFPNLKHLKVKYSCGVFKNNKGEYQVYLPNVTLEYLRLDVTPLVFKMTQSLWNKMNFVLDVQTERLRQLYSVDLREGGPMISKIDNPPPVRHFDGNKIETLRIHVILTDVQFITMYLFKKALIPSFPAYKSGRYFDCQPEDIIELKLNVHSLNQPYMHWEFISTPSVLLK